MARACARRADAGWCLLLIAQAWLIRNRRGLLHRSLGKLFLVWRHEPFPRTATPFPKMSDASAMAKYLISFPSAAMVVPDDEWETVGRDAHAVIDDAKAAGVYVFGGGIDESVPPVLVSADGAVAKGGYPWAPPLNGGFTVLELASRDDAVAWAARIARACRCSQELRVFQFDPQS
jgi:hypothetical protein